MDPDEKRWVTEALVLCEDATRKNALVLFARKTGDSADADVIVTNARTPDLIAAMNGNYRSEDDDEDEDEE